MAKLRCSSDIAFMTMNELVGAIHLHNCPQCGGKMRMEIQHGDEANPFVFMFAHADGAIFGGGDLKCDNNGYYAVPFYALSPWLAMHICDIAVLWNNGVDIFRKNFNGGYKPSVELLRYAFQMENVKIGKPEDAQ